MSYLKMENSQGTDMLHNSISIQTIIAFGIVILTEIIILSIVGAGYYHRDLLMNIVKDFTQRFNTSQSNDNSWYN